MAKNAFETRRNLSKGGSYEVYLRSFPTLGRMPTVSLRPIASGALDLVAAVMKVLEVVTAESRGTRPVIGGVEN